MSAWFALMEAVGADPDDELAGFAGELRGRPNQWPDRAPGHRSMEAMIRMHDGTRGKLIMDRGDGTFDAILYVNPEAELEVVRRTEFEFESRPFYPPPL